MQISSCNKCSVYFVKIPGIRTTEEASNQVPGSLFPEQVEQNPTPVNEMGKQDE